MFSKISITQKAVTLAWTVREASGAETTTEFSSPERPLPEFAEALEAFVDYVMELLGLPESWREELKITTLSISEDKSHNKGLVVTALREIEKADNRPLVLNTPLMREGLEKYSSAEIEQLANSIVELIAKAEVQAHRYHKGERVQTDMFATTTSSEPSNADAPDIANPADVAKQERAKRARKPRKPAGQGGTEDIANPASTEPPTDETLRQLLIEVGKDIPLDAIAKWASSERDQAQAWATSIKLARESQDSAVKIKVVSVPLCVQRDSLKPLLGKEEQSAAAVN